MSSSNIISAFLRQIPLIPRRASRHSFASDPGHICPWHLTQFRAASSMSINTSSSASGGKSSASAQKRPRGGESGQRKASKGELSNVGISRPTIQWYPGHIAKAERALQESLKVVDVVIEVRDCRIPIATAHPLVPKWIGSRTHVLALGRADLVPDAARAEWRTYLRGQGLNPRFVDAKRGRGVKELKKLAVETSATLNERRRNRGLLPRPVRCLVIGYPNVGKSALINRLVGRKAAKSANKPGVTRNFQWVRISEEIDLLDMPGIIPAQLVDQDTALRLAICDDIGHAAYDRQIAAALLIEELKRVVAELEGYFDVAKVTKRFKVDPMEVTGEEFLYLAAERNHQGDMERTAMRLLTEFRSGELGLVALESPAML